MKSIVDIDYEKIKGLFDVDSDYFLSLLNALSEYHELINSGKMEPRGNQVSAVNFDSYCNKQKTCFYFS